MLLPRTAYQLTVWRPLGAVEHGVASRVFIVVHSQK